MAPKIQFSGETAGQTPQTPGVPLRPHVQAGPTDTCHPQNAGTSQLDRGSRGPPRALTWKEPVWSLLCSGWLMKLSRERRSAHVPPSLRLACLVILLLSPPHQEENQLLVTVKECTGKLFTPCLPRMDGTGNLRAHPRWSSLGGLSSPSASAQCSEPPVRVPLAVSSLATHVPVSTEAHQWFRLNKREWGRFDSG